LWLTEFQNKDLPQVGFVLDLPPFVTLMPFWCIKAFFRALKQFLNTIKAG
jgi:hypothetical protein